MRSTIRRALLTLAASGFVALRVVGCTGGLTAPPANEDAGTLGDDSSVAQLDGSLATADGASDVHKDATTPSESGADATTPEDASDAALAADAHDSSAPLDASDAAAPADAADAASSDTGALADAGLDGTIDDSGGDSSVDSGGADAAIDGSLCPAGGCPASCAAILAQDAGAADGAYVIDPGTGPIAVACLMSVNGGGWTPLVPGVASALDTVASKVYLYALGAAWYESPASTLAWSWSAGQQLTGTYSYFNGTSGSSYSCAGSSEVPQFGVGCSNGAGGNAKTLPYYSKDPANARCEVCQDQPNAFGTGACGTGVAVYVR